MVSVKIQEGTQGLEYGQVRLSGAVYDDSVFLGENTFVGRYASECVSIHYPELWKRAAKRRVRQNARRRYLAERCSQIWLV